MTSLDPTLSTPPPALLPHKRRRPRGTEKRRRSESVLVRLTEEELATANAAAEATGQSVAGYARALITGGKPRAVSRPVVDRKQLASALGALGKIGSNLNQLARASNMNMFTARDYEMLQEELEALVAACQ